jgi:hypothetical protein
VNSASDIQVFKEGSSSINKIQQHVPISRLGNASKTFSAVFLRGIHFYGTFSNFVSLTQTVFKLFLPLTSAVPKPTPLKTEKEGSNNFFYSFEKVCYIVKRALRCCYCHEQSIHCLCREAFREK